MKRLSAFSALTLLSVTVHAALPQPDVLAEIHFAGIQNLTRGANAAPFTSEFCSDEASSLRQQTADKLAVSLAGWLQTNMNVVADDGPARLRPLLDDLQNDEWFFESRAAADGKPEFAIAIQLPPPRQQLWQRGLVSYFPAATFKTTGGWLTIGSSPKAADLLNRLAQKMTTPANGWLNLDINWPRLAQWYPALKDLGIPETQFTFTTANNEFQVSGKCLFPSPLALNLEPWRMPTNALHQPINSFTAVRGFGSWLQSQKWAQAWQISPAPNQMVAWSLNGLPFQTYAAIPVPDAAQALAQAYARLKPVIDAANARGDLATPVSVVMTNKEVDLTMPFVSPKFHALSEPHGNFLAFELFPNAPRGRPLPAELWQRLAAKDLVYYHWELTTNRMAQMLQTSQFGLMITRHKQLAAQSHAFKWLQHPGFTTGVNETYVTQSGPAELTVVRSAPGLFTATEFYMLANWLEATNFPGCNLKLPPRSTRYNMPNHPAFPLTPRAAPPTAPPAASHHA